MKIVYLTDQFYLHGGIEKMLSLKIEYLIKNLKYDVVLCTSEHKQNNFVYELPSELVHLDLDINYQRTKSYFHPINLIKSFKHYKKLKRVLAELKPDVIISVNYTPEQFFLPFIEKNIPKIKEFHSSGSNVKNNNGIIGKLKSYLFSLFAKYDTLVLLNEKEKEYYPFNNLEVIPNFILLPVKKQLVDREKIIIAAGRIAPVKQFDHLIKAWELIENEFPLWQVQIYGGGDEELLVQFNQYINNKNIPRVHFMGATNSLIDKMQKASIYAMTSSSECFPMVLLEAMACGLPIISYDCPNGPRSIIIDQVDGVLTPCNDINTFAFELKRLIQSKDLIVQMGEIGMENVKQYSEIAIMNKWNQLFSKLIS